MATYSLRAVTIDLWFTLIFDTDESGLARATARLAALRAAFAELGWDIDEPRLAQAYERCGIEHARYQESGRDLSADDHVALFLRLLEEPRGAEPVAFARVRAAYVESVREAQPYIMPGALGLLTLLRGAGLRLALISNAGRTSGQILRHYLESNGLAGYFDALLFSDELALAKPNPAIFAEALERLGAQPAEAVHIGDDLVLDYLGAQRAGMRAVIVRAERPPDLEPPHQWAPDLAQVPEKLWVAPDPVTRENGEPA